VLKPVLDSFHCSQKSSFNENMICRCNAAPLNAVLKMAPPPGQSTQPCGVSRLTLLKRLKMSARNCRATLSRSGMLLATETSLWKKPGPRREFLPALPKVPTAAHKLSGSRSAYTTIVPFTTWA